LWKTKIILPYKIPWWCSDIVKCVFRIGTALIVLRIWVFILQISWQTWSIVHISRQIAMVALPKWWYLTTLQPSSFSTSLHKIWQGCVSMNLNDVHSIYIEGNISMNNNWKMILKNYVNDNWTWLTRKNFTKQNIMMV